MGQLAAGQLVVCGILSLLLLAWTGYRDPTIAHQISLDVIQAVCPCRPPPRVSTNMQSVQVYTDTHYFHAESALFSPVLVRELSPRERVPAPCTFELEDYVGPRMYDQHSTGRHC